MLPQPLPTTQDTRTSHGGPGHGQGAEVCPRCGVVDRPALTAGSGPHACRGSCAHCGRFLKWISLVAPSERHARRVRERLAAMQQHPPTQAQLDFLQALGDTLAQPATMAEASTRIERLLQERQGA